MASPARRDPGRGRPGAARGMRNWGEARLASPQKCAGTTPRTVDRAPASVGAGLGAANGARLEGSGAVPSASGVRTQLRRRGEIPVGPWRGQVSVPQSRSAFGVVSRASRCLSLPEGNNAALRADLRTSGLGPGFPRSRDLERGLHGGELGRVAPSPGVDAPGLLEAGEVGTEVPRDRERLGLARGDRHLDGVQRGSDLWAPTIWRQSSANSSKRWPRESRRSRRAQRFCTSSPPVLPNWRASRVARQRDESLRRPGLVSGSGSRSRKRTMRSTTARGSSTNCSC